MPYLRSKAIAVTVLLVVWSPKAADACQWSLGTEFQGEGPNYRMPAEGPLVIEVERYSDETPTEIPFTESELAVRVTGPMGDVAGTVELEDARHGQRLYWTPEAPLEEVEHELSLEHAGSSRLSRLFVEPLKEVPTPSPELRGVYESLCGCRSGPALAVLAPHASAGSGRQAPPPMGA